MDDERIINNRKIYCLPVINGYDPNDIAVNPSSCPEGYVTEDDVLTYKIRFQNTGNAEAININVYDTLSKHLDLSTFKVVSNSHGNILNTYVHNDSVMQFSFDNIWLKDSTTNAPESHGYIIYQIKAKTGLPIGTQITAEADIYFDFNPAIVTNTVTSTIADHIPSCQVRTLGVEDIKKVEFELSPNPSNGNFKVITNSSNGIDVLLLDVNGTVLESISSNGNVVVINKKLSPGVYFVKVTERNGESSFKKLVVQ